MQLMPKTHDYYVGSQLPVFNRLVEDVFNTFGVLSNAERTAWYPALDLYETSEGFVVCLELPGVAKDKIEISVADGLLTIKGEKAVDSAENMNWFRRERRYGTFVRSIELPGSVDANLVVADLVDGVLTVTLPKAEISKVKTVEIRTGK